MDEVEQELSPAEAHPLDPPSHERHWVRTAGELAEALAARAGSFDAVAELPVENLSELHASGLDAAFLPAEVGGENMSFRTFGEVVRVLSAACPSTACIWLMHVGAAVTLAELSEPDTAGFYADELRAGKRFAYALPDPAMGEPSVVPAERATATKGGYVLMGAKRFASGSAIADHFLVNAVVDNIPAFFGVAADETISIARGSWDTLGLRASGSHLIELEGTALRADRRCARLQEEHPRHIGAGVSWLSLGIADAALQALISFAKACKIPPERKLLADQDWLRRQLADVHTRLAAAKMLARQTMWLADHRDPGFLTAMIQAKMLGNSMAEEAAQLALNAGAGQNFLRGAAIERHFRDAHAGWLMAYSSHACQEFLGADLLVKGRGVATGVATV
ncbi:acyl-CoA dehydrogenase [Amycolatopsis sp. WAC 01375]|uniref:acyl-CoA dehydrogenase family protein n=1 Tax=Amycolatopsis sp. WAC 01375 TaxID=2203194 RepID=UPI000F7B9F2B|nr:acyl-CoA dehydrogenase family protein [Amycolatopsis sp. WAC 01375]RSM80576.1 acyl-CoA dehydrogenase [Amycolatopsis sp. WAC 01375]